MKEQTTKEGSNKFMCEKHFLIVDESDYHNKELESLLEERVKLFIINTLGKDVLDKVDIQIDQYDDESYEEYLSIRILFNEYFYNSKEHEERQCLGISLINKGFQAFFGNGEFFSKVVYEWLSGWTLQDGVDQVYGLSSEDIYNKFNDNILTC